MTWTYHDGGRSLAGYEGTARDCACRSIAIVTELPYSVVYAGLNQQAKQSRKGRSQGTARTGVTTKVIRLYLDSLGLNWKPTMGIGTGCRVHLRDGDLPSGRLVVRCSGHITAVIDGKVQDTHDPTRAGTRCVYGYWY